VTVPCSEAIILDTQRERQVTSLLMGIVPIPHPSCLFCLRSTGRKPRLLLAGANIGGSAGVAGAAGVLGCGAEGNVRMLGVGVEVAAAVGVNTEAGLLCPRYVWPLEGAEVVVPAVLVRRDGEKSGELESVVTGV
jgi:hypothetical protein